MADTLKLSSETIAILKSFASINPNILIREGNKLATRSETKTMQGRATVSEVFPKQFAIYDLPQFLTIVNLMSEPTLDFREDHMWVKSANGGKTKYFYTDESMVEQAAPNTNELELETVAEFPMKIEVLAAIQKVSSVITATTVSFVGDGSNVKVVVSDPKNPKANTYEVQVAETDKEFKVLVDIAHFRPLINDEYTIIIGFPQSNRHPVVKMISQNKAESLYYLTTTSPLSKVVE